MIIIMAGCSLEKKNGFNRTMQNLTAHYNILFNAKEILRQKQESYTLGFIDNYNEVLSVYTDTALQGKTPDKDLELAITKATTVINFKEQSKYLGDAYLILGKANYLEANYFNAVEYFSYVVKSFPQRADLVQEALTWKARALMYLGQLPLAKLNLDTALLNLNPKKLNPVDVYATKLQYDINVQEYVDAEEMAKKAIQFSGGVQQRLRWEFILGQIQELNQKPADAINSYAQIAKSNASFEMAFNASLNRIRIEDQENGVKVSRIERLLGLLKNPNNKEFQDQIYYQVAQLQMAAKDVNGAIKSYNLSVRRSLKNQNQKGLSYLRLAEINFKIKADYITAKKYYDSTLTSLPGNYPGYAAIQKIGGNLNLLADRLQIIAREDTLQALVKMDEKTRMAVIDKMVRDKLAQQQAIANTSAAANTSGFDASSQTSGNSSFYFYNSTALSQGFSDFRRKWGNRKLEDNWRRSNRTNSDITANAPGIAQNNDPDAPANPIQTNKSRPVNSTYRQDLMTSLPLTPVLLAQSNLRIYNAYVDIGNFYRDILDDKKEAIASYESVLKRFPNDPNKPAIYYNLYRLYSDIDAAKSNQYKNILLRDYAATPFAKVILDPDYAKKLDDADAEATQAYNTVFDLYAHKQYKEVIRCVPEVLKQFPANKFSAQLYYLQALSAAHNESAAPFRDSLEQIIKRFPSDKLIAPLVKQHLDYIAANKADVEARSVVLADNNPDEIPFTLTQSLKKQTEYRKVIKEERVTGPYIEVQGNKVAVAADYNPRAVKPSTVKGPEKPVVKPADTSPSIFSMRDSTNYYFVVNVSTATTNLSSSRFGIGQFNRANYAGNGIKHLLMPIGPDNQLIYVGKFLTLSGVKKYAHEIIPLMPDIMKVPRDKYTFFIITQENLNKLADKKTLDSYLDFYQKNY